MLKGKFINLFAGILACSFVASPSFAADQSSSSQSEVSKPVAEKAQVENQDKTDEKVNQVYNEVPHLGVNINVYAGYVRENWSSFTNHNHGAWAQIGGIRPHTNAQGAFNIGGDLGYQIIRYFGIELGYYYFQQVKGDNLTIETPYFYAATKVSYPFLANDDLSVFAKLGVAYRMIEYGGSAQTGPYQNKRYSFNPLYGLGVQYYISHRWKASAQWLQIPSRTNGSPNTKKSSKQVPMTNQVLLGLGYLFTI